MTNNKWEVKFKEKFIDWEVKFKEKFIDWEVKFKEKFIDIEVSDLDGKLCGYLNDKAEEITPIIDFISSLRQQDRDELLKIADSGEFEDMRREVTNYYNK